MDYVFHNLADRDATNTILDEGTRAQRISGKWILDRDSLAPISNGENVRSGKVIYVVSFYRLSSEDRNKHWTRWQDEKKPAYLAKNAGLGRTELELARRHEGFPTASLSYSAADWEFDSPPTWYLTCSLPAEIWDALCSEVLEKRCNGLTLAIDFDEILIPVHERVDLDHLIGNTFHVPQGTAGTHGWLNGLTWTTRTGPFVEPELEDDPDVRQPSDEQEAVVSEVTKLQQALQAEMQFLRSLLERSTWLIIAAIVIAVLVLRK
ncbi:MAG: hypothetical protein ACYC2K_13270 [Gemmatimonadales bacterium]